MVDALMLADYALATTEPDKRVVSVELLAQSVSTIESFIDATGDMEPEDADLLAELRAAIGGQP